MFYFSFVRFQLNLEVVQILFSFPSKKNHLNPLYQEKQAENIKLLFIFFIINFYFRIYIEFLPAV